MFPTGRLLERCSRLRRAGTARPDELATRLVLRNLARRIDAATAEAAELEREILAHVRALAPQLLDEPGIGPIVAAQLIVAWSHRGRLRSEAAFARLVGVAPRPASRRHGIDSAAAAAANSTARSTPSSSTAGQDDSATKDYITTRTAEGKSTREAIRLLKRYLARHLFRLLQNQEPLMA